MRSLVPVMTKDQMISEGLTDHWDEIAANKAERREERNKKNARERERVINGRFADGNQMMSLDEHRRALIQIDATGKEWDVYRDRLRQQRYQEKCYTDQVQVEQEYYVRSSNFIPV